MTPATLPEASAAPAAPRLAVAVPAYNAQATLPACLAAINGGSRRPDVLILYDDGSTDATGDIARAHGATVIRNDGAPRGPGAGRNAAVAASGAELVAFVDADVVVAPGALERLEAVMRADGALAAAFGSYDDAPASRRLAALYANLRHHYVHQRGKADAATFWAGLGIVRRSHFEAVGGFDPRYVMPSIEDIELGFRLRRAGHRIRLDPAAQGKHLKDWGLLQLWRTDIRQRALPWSRLIAQGGDTGGGLNTSSRDRISALAAGAAVVALPAAAVGAPAWLPAAFLAAYAALNHGLLRLLARNGPGVALGGGALHFLHHLYSASVFVGVHIAAGGGAPLRRKPKAQRQDRQNPSHP